MTKTVSLMMLNNDIATLVVHVLFPRDGPRGGRAAEEGEGHGGRLCRSSSFGAERAHYCVPGAKSQRGAYFMLHQFAALPLTSVKAHFLQVEYSLLAENEGVKECHNGFITSIIDSF